MQFGFHGCLIRWWKVARQIVELPNRSLVIVGSLATQASFLNYKSEPFVQLSAEEPQVSFQSSRLLCAVS